MSELAISGKQPDEIKLGNKPEYSEADRILLWVVIQNVSQRSEQAGVYDSCFLRANADALRYLCRIGLMRPISGYENEVDGGGRDFMAEEIK